MPASYNADRIGQDRLLSSWPDALHRASLFAAIVPMRQRHADNHAQAPLRSRNSLMTSDIFISREFILVSRQRMAGMRYRQCTVEIASRDEKECRHSSSHAGARLWSRPSFQSLKEADG